MDPGSYGDLTGRIYGLLIVLEDCLNGDDVSVIHQFTVVRHDSQALGEIARTGAHRQIGITVREHAGALALAGLGGVLARANRAPPAGELVRELAAHG
jgi:hypothetical protein